MINFSLSVNVCLYKCESILSLEHTLAAYTCILIVVAVGNGEVRAEEQVCLGTNTLHIIDLNWTKSLTKGCILQCLCS